MREGIEIQTDRQTDDAHRIREKKEKKMIVKSSQ